MKNYGNKAKNLAWLMSNGFAVPDFLAVAPQDIFLNYSELRQIVLENIKKGNHGAGAEFEKLKFNGNKIAGLENFGGKITAFRTSSSLEDGAVFSFAGLYDTFLDVPFCEESFRKYAVLCVKSAFSPRVISYLRANNLDCSLLDCSVIIQEMFSAQYAGVSFVGEKDCDSVTVWSKGSCRNIVDGGDADQFTLDNVSLEFNRLKGSQELIEELKRIVNLKSKPQDIEWALSEGVFAILQTRDITKKIPFLQNYGQIFDRTNIAESYPGITSPLTYSFIDSLYSKVYISFFSLVGAKVEDNDRRIFENLLGYIKGRVYYRIENWYAFLKLLPGYKYNKEFFESMLMPQKNRDEKRAKQNIAGSIRCLPVAFKFAVMLFFGGKGQRIFLDNFDKQYTAHKKIDLGKMNDCEIIEYYETARNKFLDDWKIPIMNDFRLMVFYGILKKIIVKKYGSEAQSVLNRLISDFSKANYYESIKGIEDLAVHARRNQKIAAIFAAKGGDAIETIRASHDPEVLQFIERIDCYLDRNCWRHPDELKLESIDIKDDPALIANLIASYPELPEPKKESEITGGMVVKFFSRKTRQAIKDREVFRARRAMVFGVAKDCFMQLAENFVKSGIINIKDDIYFLTVADIRKAANGAMGMQECRNLIKGRKKDIEEYKEIELPDRIIIAKNGGCEIILDDTVPGKDGLAGMAVSAGIVRGPVLVLEKFDPAANFNGKILVTYQTDPGWSLVFPLLKGVILERGNALSHASILSREMNIPLVVKVKNAVSLLKNCRQVELNGNNGNIKIIEK